MANIVLVHGAWHGGWCWRRVSDILTARGHRVFAPTMTGLADRSHLLSASVDLNTHINDVANLIEWEDLDRVVLCGHSYAGMVITGVAERVKERLGAIVYLDAMVPEDGQCLFDIVPEELFGPPEPAAYAPVPPEVFYLEGADADWVRAKVTPQPAGTLRQPLRVTGAYQRVPKKVYILAAKGEAHPAVVVPYERFRQDPSWTAIKMTNSGHEVMVEQPAELAAILEGLA